MRGVNFPDKSGEQSEHAVLMTVHWKLDQDFTERAVTFRTRHNACYTLAYWLSEPKRLRVNGLLSTTTRTATVGTLESDPAWSRGSRVL